MVDLPRSDVMIARGASRLARAARSAMASGATARTQAMPNSAAVTTASNNVHRIAAARSFARGGIRRGYASEAGAPAEEQSNVMSNVMDTVGSIGTVLGLAVGAAVGASYYTQTTEELEASVKAGDHVPSAIRGTPLQEPVEYAFANLLEFRQWADEQAHKYLDPVSDKLLPDHPPDAPYIPHTLVLDLDDCLILSDWTRERGWRVFKRPGANDFLQHMSQFYEVVVFSDQLSSYADPIIERLDPTHSCLSGRLYREATQYKNGYYLRDLTKLNRNMGKVIYVTARPKTAVQQENVVVINPYRVRGEGSPGGGPTEGRVDTTLLDLMPFLESIVRLNVQDVQEVLESYKKEQEKTGMSIPEIFRARQVRFQQAQRARSAGGKRFSRGFDTFRSAGSSG